MRKIKNECKNCKTDLNEYPKGTTQCSGCEYVEKKVNETKYNK